MKSKIFEASSEVYGEWTGRYEVKELSASEYMDVEGEIITYAEKEKLDLTKVSQYPRKYYTGLCLSRAVLRNGELLKMSPLELVEKLPSKLYTILNAMYNSLNALTQDEQRFLSSLL